MIFKHAIFLLFFILFIIKTIYHALIESLINYSMGWCLLNKQVLQKFQTSIVKSINKNASQKIILLNLKQSFAFEGNAFDCT